MNKLDKIFIDRCDRAAEVIKSVTPIDTQRLHDSTRVEVQSVSKDKVVVYIIQGGESRAGMIKEQDISKPVDYGVYVEMTQSYIRGALPDIAAALGD